MREARPSIESVRALLEYEPESGTLVWKAREPTETSDARTTASWNAKFAGKAPIKRTNGLLVVTAKIGKSQWYLPAHEVAWALGTGGWPAEPVEAVDGQLDNRCLANLRLASSVEQRDWSIEAYREAVDYDPVDGAFTWKCRPRSHFPDDRSMNVWNSKHSGQPVKKRTYGYVSIVLTLKGETRQCAAHRVAWAFTTGEWPDGEVDHKNRQRDDNRWSNLRLASRTENQHNTGKRRNNTSGFRGVYWSKQSQKWRAQIHVGSIRKVLGEFHDPELANRAYQAAARELHGEFYTAAQ